MEKVKEVEVDENEISTDEIYGNIDGIMELAIKNEELDAKAKKLFFMEKLIKKRDISIKEREEDIEKELDILEEERKKIREKQLNMQKECEERANYIVEDIKKRNEELSKKISELSKIELEYESVKAELENKKTIINELNSELYECRTNLNKLEETLDLDNIELTKQKAIRVDKLEFENKNLKKLNKDLLEENSNLGIRLGELNTLKANNEILSNRLNRSDAYIKYLKKIEESKGTGDDTSQVIFNEIIEKQEEMDKNTHGESYCGDEKFINGFIEYCNDIGYVYEKNLIRSFLCSLRSSKLTILKGYSGTGKSSLPVLFSKYLKGECVVIPIQPNWRTKQDIIGFYNYFTNKFIPTELTQTLIRANVSKDRIFIVVLDEMNLARVEYYFSEFNSKLWMDSDKRKIELFDGVSEYNGKVSKYISENKIQIPDNVFFVGTINEDDSVSPISDKIFDRAQVVEFMELPSSKSVGNLELANENIDANKYTKYSVFMSKIDNDKDVNMSIIDEVNKFTKDNFNKVIGYRSLKQVEKFIKTFKLSGGNEIDGIDIQLVSKFIPKLKYLYSNEQIENLELLNEHIKELFKQNFNCDEDKISKLNIVVQLEGIIKELNE
ncbi:AAA family ATPase [Paraclostridium bifermentans]|uniref:AAA family ATPase n=1 Tax=Paraclostridium bifermentans TaxID=1490 RepID=UPI001F463136|nr:AAA family ATPase [Paraclostridium bifermentans]MCE9675733.1 AAA family ATPase [Paraclostridium bifermentans]